MIVDILHAPVLNIAGSKSKRSTGGRCGPTLLVDFSDCSVATGLKPVVSGRAVHSSNSSLVGYWDSCCGERANERTNGGLPLLLPLFLHTRENECTHITPGLAPWLAVHISSSIGCWLLVPCTPPFVSQVVAKAHKGTYVRMDLLFFVHSGNLHFAVKERETTSGFVQFIL